MYRFIARLSGFLVFLPFISGTPVHRIQFNGRAQGTTYHISFYAADTLVLKSQLDSIFTIIDQSLSVYQTNSLINRFNESVTGLEADGHLAKVVQKAQDTYRKTAGLFDITIFPLTQAWGFGPAKNTVMPDSILIHQLLTCVDSRLLYWKGNKLCKKKACVKLDPNGIAQGYTVDVVAEFLERRGIRNYLVELGGEIRVRGRKLPSGEKMSIGIEAPGEDPFSTIMERVIWLEKGAITTSGNYRRYHESEGRKITHLLNPKTGYSLQNELISVTVYAVDALTADAYDNALMAMGLQKALRFVERRRDLAAHFIYHKEDGSVADTLSSRFYKLLKP